MNDPNFEHSEALPIRLPGDDASVLEREVLISRIVDGEEADAAWDRLSQIGATDPLVWRDLAQSQRQHAALAGAMSFAVRIADDVELPAENGITAVRSSPVRERGGSYAFTRWSGWGIAAVLGLAWIGAMFGNLNGGVFNGGAGTSNPNGMSAPGPNTAGVAPSFANWQPRTHEEALNKYLEVGQRDGTVIGEVPRVVMIESRRGTNGAVEVFYLRQFMERAVVPGTIQFGEDERGQRTPMPVSHPRVGGKL